MRVFLVIAGCVVAFVLMLALAGYLLWRQHGEGLIASATDGIRDGEARGAASSDVECFDASVALVKECVEFRCGVYNSTFAAACLGNAASEDGLCRDVPRDPGILESMQWVESECAAIAPNRSGCADLMQVVLGYCTERPASASAVSRH